MYRNAIIKAENQKFLAVYNQNDNRSLSNAEFYEQNPPLKFLIEQVSSIATDYNMFDKK